MSVEELRTIIVGAKRRLASAERKARFLKGLYAKYRRNSPSTAASLKLVSDSADREVELLRKQIRRLAGLQKPSAALVGKNPVTSRPGRSVLSI